ncbi:MAG: hypothetical protein HGA98_01370 [Deltaproteobacteria bacterium]|nr:hypothetical protein [Deltaproteobacteria bacterium]
MPRCDVCRLRYDLKSPESVARHLRVHDALVNGFRYGAARSDRIVWAEGGLRIALVTGDSPVPQRRRAVSAFRVASREMGYSGSGYAKREPEEDEAHAFLLYRAGRMIGLFLLARRERWMEGAWNDEEPNGVAEVSGWRADRRERGETPLWSLDFMWIARKYRRQGYGRIVIGAAARTLGTTPEGLAWLPPFTPNGKAFIRHIQPVAFRAAQ